MKEFMKRIDSSDATQKIYMPVIEKCTIIGGYMVPDAIPGAEAVVSLKVGATTIGTCTFADDAAAGTPVAIVMNSVLATRKTPMTVAAPLIIESDGAQTTATAFDMVLQVDEFALVRDGL